MKGATCVVKRDDGRSTSNIGNRGSSTLSAQPDLKTHIIFETFIKYTSLTDTEGPVAYFPSLCEICSRCHPITDRINVVLYVLYVNAGLSVRHFGSNCSTSTTIGCIFLEIYGHSCHQRMDDVEFGAFKTWYKHSWLYIYTYL